jgi:hypothetical protein
VGPVSWDVTLPLALIVVGVLLASVGGGYGGPTTLGIVITVFWSSDRRSVPQRRRGERHERPAAASELKDSTALIGDSR